MQQVELFSCQKDGKLNIEYSAEDNYDGVITDKVKEKIDANKVIFKCC